MKHTLRRGKEYPTEPAEVTEREPKVLCSVDGIPVTIIRRTDGYTEIIINGVSCLVNALELQEALRNG